MHFDDENKRPVSTSQGKPWLDDHGIPLPDSVLKVRARTWSGETWSAYLKSLEVGRHEDLGVAKDRSILLEEFQGTGDEVCASSHELYESEFRSERQDRVLPLTGVVRNDYRSTTQESPVTEEVIADDEVAAPLVAQSADAVTDNEARRDLIEAAMQQLTENEQLVLWHLFWEGRSERDICVLMRRSRRTVRVWRDRAFVKLRELLSPTFRKEEGASLSQKSEQSNFVFPERFLRVSSKRS